MRTGEVNDGIESYRRASKINPLDPTAWQGLCNLFLETGRVGEYIDAVGELIQALVNKLRLPRNPTLDTTGHTDWIM